MRPFQPLAVTVLLVALAGCASPDPSPAFHLSGSFTADRTQQDLDEFDAIVAPYSDDVAILESFPEQFSIRGIEGGCEQLRSTLDAKDYVASVGTCRVQSEAGAGGDDADNDGATSSP